MSKKKYIDSKMTGGRQINGTVWPVETVVYKIGPKKWEVVRGLCNGVPASSETFSTLREAMEAFAN